MGDAATRLRAIGFMGSQGFSLMAMLAYFVFFLCEASELFPYSKGKIHEDFDSTREDVAFKRNGMQLDKPTDCLEADTLEVWLKTRKEDQKRLGAVLSRRNMFRGTRVWHHPA